MSACASAEEEESSSTIVLSGDSCCDAIVTFDLTSSEPSGASTAADNAAADTEPPESDARGSQYTEQDVADVQEGEPEDPTCGDNSAGDVLEEDVPGDYAGNDLSPLPFLESGFADDDYICEPPPLPPLSPPPPPREPSFAFAARNIETEEDEEPMFDMQDFHCNAAPRPKRTAAVPSSLPPLGDVAEPPFKASSASSAAPVAGNRIVPNSLVPRGAVHSAAELSLSQKASRRSRHETELECSVPVRSRSQPIGVRPAQRAAPLEKGGGEAQGTGSSVEGRGLVPQELMPSFKEMTLQELAGMMSVYGLKKKSKRFGLQLFARRWCCVQFSHFVVCAHC